jgi:hypothetical protein
MSEIKKAISIACFMGVIGTIIDMISPSGGMKKHLMSLLGLITLLAVISPFVSSGFSLSLDDIDLSADIEIEKTHTSADVNEIFLEEAKLRYDEYFTDLLNKNDITDAEINTRLSFTADNELEISEIDVKLSDLSLSEEAEKLISAEVSGAEIRIGKAEDEDTASTVG